VKKYCIVTMIMVVLLCSSLLMAKDRKCDIIRADHLLYEDYIVLVINDHSCRMKLCLVRLDFSYQTKAGLDQVVDLFVQSGNHTNSIGSDSTHLRISDQNLLLQLVELPDTLKVKISAEPRGGFSWDTYFRYDYRGRAYRYVDVKNKKFLLPVYSTPDLIYNKDGLIYVRREKK